MIFSGKVKGRNGVAVVLDKRIKNFIESIRFVNDRLVMGKIEYKAKRSSTYSSVYPYLRAY